MAHTPSIKEKALNLRRVGYSYSYISSKTGLSKSTLSDWLGTVPYTPNAETQLAIGKALAASGEKIARKKLESIAHARELAKKDIGRLSKRDLFMFGLGLYLGEGNKTHDLVRVVNSNPAVICLAIAWFESLGLSKKNFAITLHLYPDSDLEKSQVFWSRVTGIPRNQFLKTQIDWRKNKKTYKMGKLPHGTAQLAVRGMGEKKFGVFLARQIHAWTEEVIRETSTRVWSTGMTRPFQGR